MHSGFTAALSYCLSKSELKPSLTFTSLPLINEYKVKYKVSRKEGCIIPIITDKFYLTLEDQKAL